MSGRIAAALVAGLLASTASKGRALAQLIPLTEPQGQDLLWRSRTRADFLPLIGQFVTQANLAYCGVASAMMALNSLAVPAPETPGYAPYRFWTAENLFAAPAARAVVAPETVARRGITKR